MPGEWTGAHCDIPIYQLKPHAGWIFAKLLKLPSSHFDLADCRHRTQLILSGVGRCINRHGQMVANEIKAVPLRSFDDRDRGAGDPGVRFLRHDEAALRTFAASV